MDAVNAVLYTRYMGEYLSYDAGQGVQLMDGGVTNMGDIGRG